jgi:hypothetical protein
MALKLTSVKLEERLFEDFKVASIRHYGKGNSIKYRPPL